MWWTRVGPCGRLVTARTEPSTSPPFILRRDNNLAGAKSLAFFLSSFVTQNCAIMPRDLLHPSAAEEVSKHKLRRLVQSPNSYFMDVKCPGCFNITTVFSHAQTVVLCGSCSVMLCQPTGGKARLTDGCQYRKKTE